MEENVTFTQFVDEHDSNMREERDSLYNAELNFTHIPPPFSDEQCSNLSHTLSLVEMYHNCGVNGFCSALGSIFEYGRSIGEKELWRDMRRTPPYLRFHSFISTTQISYKICMIVKLKVSITQTRKQKESKRRTVLISSPL